MKTLNATEYNNAAITAASQILEANGAIVINRLDKNDNLSVAAVKNDKSVILSHSGITFINNKNGTKCASFWKNLRINPMVIASDIDSSEAVEFLAGKNKDINTQLAA